MKKTAIEVATTSYIFSHGHNPRGFGSWAFTIKGEIKWFNQSTYGEALKKAKQFVRDTYPGQYVTIIIEP